MIDYITYNGDQIPVNLGVIAFKRTKAELKKSFETALTEDDTLAYETLLWHSIEAGYYLIKKENPYKKEDAEWIFNECEDSFLELYVNSQMKAFERNKQQLSKMGISVEDAVKIQNDVTEALKKTKTNSGTN